MKPNKSQHFTGWTWKHQDFNRSHPKLSQHCSGRTGGQLQMNQLRADHTGQFRHHLSKSSAIIVRKAVGHQLFLKVIPSNFTARTKWKVWCDLGMSLRNNQLKFETSGELPIILYESILEYTSSEQIKTGRCQHVTC